MRDLAAPVDQQPHLAADVVAHLGELAGELTAQQAVCREAPAEEPFEALGVVFETSPGLAGPALFA